MMDRKDGVGGLGNFRHILDILSREEKRSKGGMFMLKGVSIIALVSEIIFL